MRRYLAWAVAAVTTPFVLGYAAMWSFAHAANTWIIESPEEDEDA